jgi:hypothetical protein
MNELTVSWRGVEEWPKVRENNHFQRQRGEMPQLNRRPLVGGSWQCNNQQSAIRQPQKAEGYCKSGMKHTQMS